MGNRWKHSWNKTEHNTHEMRYPQNKEGTKTCKLDIRTGDKQIWEHMTDLCQRMTQTKRDTESERARDTET